MMKYGPVSGLDKPVSRIVLGSVVRPRSDPGPFLEIMDQAFDRSEERRGGEEC